MDNKVLNIKNGSCVKVSEIPVLSYDCFRATTLELMSDKARHCSSYFAYPCAEGLRLMMCIADDTAHDIKVFACDVNKGDSLVSAAKDCLALERYEREIHENWGLEFEEHPWYKPVRDFMPGKYKFFEMEGEELHEVGVGPVHAGVIEPGHFRFICNGEDVLHLEIQLGWQHRGVEHLMLSKKRTIERVLLAEGIAGDTSVSHSTAFAGVWEALCGIQPDKSVLWARTLAAELERMANHTGDLGAICGDVAYQLGAAVYGRLRTPIVNFSQRWCGNRLGKGNVRPAYAPYAFTEELRQQLLSDLKAYERDFLEMSDKIQHFPGVLSRLDRTGIVTTEQAESIGAVGMAAKCAGVCRDTRASHPYGVYGTMDIKPVVKDTGDVLARTELRIDEVKQSLAIVRTLLEDMPAFNTQVRPMGEPMADCFAISLTEGWRGEICHCAVTDADGELAAYKIKDPSFHNWMALALAVRGNEISDFPICNKSFNLSYCGHDL
ncbi:MAG: NADH dehydrogenase subunit [Bacteroidales bacterium]|nr:NADH dehydrogenase subunit [Bacteroidales bacterium]